MFVDTHVCCSGQVKHRVYSCSPGLLLLRQELQWVYSKEIWEELG